MTKEADQPRGKGITMMQRFHEVMWLVLTVYATFSAAAAVAADDSATDIDKGRREHLDEMKRVVDSVLLATQDAPAKRFVRLDQQALPYTNPIASLLVKLDGREVWNSPGGNVAIRGDSQVLFALFSAGQVSVPADSP